MASYTGNLNLKKPALDDDALITDINNNMDILDAAVNGIQDGLAIVANGNTHVAITSGQFVYVRNHSTLTEGLYVASTNIAANATLRSSNLTADAAGGLNALNSKLTHNVKNLGTFYGLGCYLITNGGCNTLKIQGTLMQDLTEYGTYPLCDSSEMSGSNFNSYIAGVEFNTATIIGFYLANGKLNMQPKSSLASGRNFSIFITWC